MKLAEVITYPDRKTFELTSIESYVDEEVFNDMLEAHNILLLFNGQRLMTSLLSQACLNVQYEYLEQTYGVNKRDVTNDDVTAFFYNPKDKHIYVSMTYRFKDAQDKSDPMYMDMHVNFKVGKDGAKALEDAELEEVKRTDDLLHVEKIANILDI